MGHVERITVYPVKGLGGVALEEARVLQGGTIQHDREFALFDATGEVVNGKRTDRVHDLETSFDPEKGALTVDTDGGERRRFDLETDRDRAAEWFGEFFGADLTLARDRSVGFVDRREMGPSVISTATLETVASWFEGVTVEGARRRLRANVEVGGVPAFWEDRFVGRDAPSFLAGGVRFEGVTPCGRCVVPERDPDTGDRDPGFRERFVRKRRERFPEWADRDEFDHDYTLMLIARVAEEDRGGTIEAGDPVRVVGE
ncbi:MAG: MOSC N-terminal beta barrel domain-containing protein [Haloarculaceae archaeon]